MSEQFAITNASNPVARADIPSIVDIPYLFDTPPLSYCPARAAAVTPPRNRGDSHRDWRPASDGLRISARNRHPLRRLRR